MKVAKGEKFDTVTLRNTNGYLIKDAYEAFNKDLLTVATTNEKGETVIVTNDDVTALCTDILANQWIARPYDVVYADSLKVNDVLKVWFVYSFELVKVISTKTGVKFLSEDGEIYPLLKSMRFIHLVGAELDSEGVESEE